MTTYAKKTLKRLSPLAFVFLGACTSMETINVQVSHSESTTREDGSSLQYGEIKAYTIAAAIPNAILEKETPLNQQDIYRDLVLYYKADDYIIDSIGSMATLPNMGWGGEDYDLFALGDEIPQKRNIGTIGTTFVFDNVDDILTSASAIDPFFFQENDGYTVIMNGQLICNGADQTPGSMLESIFQIGPEAVLISQEADQKGRIITQSSGTGDTFNDEHYQTIGCNTPFALLHRGEGDNGRVETIVIKKDMDYLDQTVWYSVAENSGPDHIRHISSNSSPVDGMIALGGDLYDATSHASIAIKELQFYNEAIDFNRMLLLASKSAKDVGIDARLLIASRLTEAYKNVDFYTLTSHTSTYDQMNSDRENELAFYETYAPFLTNTTSNCDDADYCYQGTAVRFSDVTAVATDADNLTSKEAWINRLHIVTDSFPSLMFSVDSSNSFENDTLEEMPNLVSAHDPNRETKELSVAAQYNTQYQPQLTYNTDPLGNDPESIHTYDINNRSAMLIDGTDDYMIVTNFDETNVTVPELITEGFTYTAVFQLDERTYNDKQPNVIWRLGTELQTKNDQAVTALVTSKTDSCTFHVVHGGTQIADPIQTNCFPVAVSVYSPPAQIIRDYPSGYRTYESTGIHVYVNGEEIETNAVTKWHLVDGSHTYNQTGELSLAIGANATRIREPYYSSTGMKFAMTALWTKQDFDAARDYMNRNQDGRAKNMVIGEKSAQEISSVLAMYFGITASGLPEKGPRRIQMDNASAPPTGGGAEVITAPVVNMP